MKTIIILVLVAISAFARAGVVTLVALQTDETNIVGELTVGPYEVAEVVSFPRSINGGNRARIQITKGGMTFPHTVESLRGASEPSPLGIALPSYYPRSTWLFEWCARQDLNL
jgi:hypothetical protein